MTPPPRQSDNFISLEDLLSRLPNVDRGKTPIVATCPNPDHSHKNQKNRRLAIFDRGDGGWNATCPSAKCKPHPAGYESMRHALADWLFPEIDTRQWGQGSWTRGAQQPHPKQKKRGGRKTPQTKTDEPELAKEIEEQKAKTTENLAAWEASKHVLDCDMPCAYIEGRGVKLDDSLRGMEMNYATIEDILDNGGPALLYGWRTKAHGAIIWRFSSLQNTDADFKTCVAVQYEMLGVQNDKIVRLKTSAGKAARFTYGRVRQKAWLAKAQTDITHAVGLCEGQIDALNIRQDFGIPVAATAGIDFLRHLHINSETDVYVFADPGKRAGDASQKWSKDHRGNGGFALTFHANHPENTKWDYSDIVTHITERDSIVGELRLRLGAPPDEAMEYREHVRKHAHELIAKFQHFTVLDENPEKDTQPVSEKQKKRRDREDRKALSAKEQIEASRSITDMSRVIWDACDLLGEYNTYPGMDYMERRGWDPDCAGSHEMNVRYIPKGELGELLEISCGDETDGYLVWPLFPASDPEKTRSGSRATALMSPQREKHDTENDKWLIYDVKRLYLQAISAKGERVPADDIGEAVARWQQGFIWKVGRKEVWASCVVGESPLDVLVHFQDGSFDGGIAVHQSRFLKDIKLKPRTTIYLLTSESSRSDADGFLRDHEFKGGKSNVLDIAESTTLNHQTVA